MASVSLQGSNAGARMMSVARELKASIRSTGWELTTPPGRYSPYRLRPMNLPPLGGLQRGPRPDVLIVPVEKCSTSIGFSYAADGWHPYVATLEALRATPDLPYEATPLAKLYERFQPTSTYESIFEDGTTPVEPLSRVAGVLRHLDLGLDPSRREFRQRLP